MAIKGKKKSQSRGSQARRRPATAPRPGPARSMKPPWYKTTAGQSLAGIATLILIVIVLVLVNNARNASEEREQRQQQLETYTEQVRALLQRIAPPATEMGAIAPTPPDGLEDTAAEWREIFTAAQTEVSQFIPPGDAAGSRDLFLEAVRLYATAASTMEIAAGLEGGEQGRLMSTATGQVTSATGVWEAAVAILDDARDEADLGASGVRAPAAAPGGAVPTPAASVPVQPGGGGGGGDEGAGGGGQGGKGKGGKGDGGDG